MTKRIKRHYLKGILYILIFTIIAIHVEFGRIIFDIRQMSDAFDLEIDQFMVNTLL